MFGWLQWDWKSFPKIHQNPNKHELLSNFMRERATEWLKSRKEYSTAIIRISLALVLLWFGIDQLRNPDYWVGFLPPWLSQLLPVSINTFLLFNGIIEIIIGIFLLVGSYTRVFGVIAFLHLLPIAVAVGYNDIAIRDLGLAAMALSLVFSGAGKLSFDERKHR